MSSLLLLTFSLLTQVNQVDKGYEKDLRTYNKDAQQHIYYLDTYAYPDDKQDEIRDVLRFVVASSTSQRVIERATPVKVSPTLYRIDTRDLKWDTTTFQASLHKYPYGDLSLIPSKPLTVKRGDDVVGVIQPGTRITVLRKLEYSGETWLEVSSGNLRGFVKRSDVLLYVPRVIRADWLIEQLGDESESTLRPLMLYGKATPSLKEVQDFWKTSREDAFGLIEGDSKVAVSKVRLLENLPSAVRGYAWGTRDSAIIDFTTDPLEHPDNRFKFTAGEWIFGMPKLSIRTFARGVLQDYGLFLADGTRQTKATADLVNDSLQFRSTAEIQNFGACVGCHPKGINPYSQNLLVDVLKLGVRLYDPDREGAERIELFHLGDVRKEIAHNQSQYADGVMLTNGRTPEDNAQIWRDFFKWYDAPVTTQQAARELRVPADMLPKVLGYANKHGIDIGGRGAMIAHGHPIPRTRFEGTYRSLQRAISLARADGLFDRVPDPPRLGEQPAINDLPRLRLPVELPPPPKP